MCWCLVVLKMQQYRLGIGQRVLGIRFMQAKVRDNRQLQVRYPVVSNFMKQWKNLLQKQEFIQKVRLNRYLIHLSQQNSNIKIIRKIQQDIHYRFISTVRNKRAGRLTQMTIILLMENLGLCSNSSRLWTHRWD